MASHRLAGGQPDLSGLAHQGVPIEPAQIQRLRFTIGIAVNGRSRYQSSVGELRLPLGDSRFIIGFYKNLFNVGQRCGFLRLLFGLFGQARRWTTASPAWWSRTW